MPSSLRAAGLMLVIVLTSQFSALAQGGRGRPPRAEAAQSPTGDLVELEKIETSGGPKTENRAPRPPRGSLIREGSALKAAELGGTVRADDSDTPGNPGSGTAKASGPNGAKTATTHDVGIIPGANGCPPGSELSTIYFDDEDKHNANAAGGWIGATVQDRNTGFKICRVDGTQLPIISGAAYAVLQLDTTCPNSAAGVFWRKFSNETYKNNNSYASASGISPNYVNKTQANSLLQFCLMADTFGTNGITQFPNLGVEYGVFAANDFPGILDSGYIDIDDEDENNKNSYGGSYISDYAQTSKIISGDLNTHINFVKVNSGAPVYGSLHSVSLNRGSVKGGSSCNDIVITVYLDGPARPGGQVVYLSSSNQQKAGIFDPKYFTIPEGQTSGSASCFMGTKSVTVDKTVTITVTVNGQPGYVNLNVTRK
jgi:hypothetical protein